jgi:hypothetical protein
MRRSFAWLAWGSGALFAFRWLRLRRRKHEAPAADPAEELRRKLDESRTDEAQDEPQPPPEQPPPSTDQRRREVHDRARASIEQMRERGRPPQ